MRPPIPPRPTDTFSAAVVLLALGSVKRVTNYAWFMPVMQGVFLVYVIAMTAVARVIMARIVRRAERGRVEIDARVVSIQEHDLEWLGRWVRRWAVVAAVMAGIFVCVGRAEALAVAVVRGVFGACGEWGVRVHLFGEAEGEGLRPWTKSAGLLESTFAKRETGVKRDAAAPKQE